MEFNREDYYYEVKTFDTDLEKIKLVVGCIWEAGVLPEERIEANRLFFTHLSTDVKIVDIGEQEINQQLQDWRPPKEEI